MGGGGGLGGVTKGWGLNVGSAGRGLADMMTFGGNELLGNPVGKLTSSMGLGGAVNNMNTPVGASNMSPMQMLTTTGGAPLLMNIALGAGVDETLASFLGLSVNDMKDIAAGNNPGVGADLKNQIAGIRNQLVQVQTNTNLRNQAVKQLATDFPNIMAQKIPQYSAIADDATKQVMNQALDQISAKMGANGQLSSGATADAAARAGAGIAMDKLNYGTQLAGQDWMNQMNVASGLQQFQQKMLGQGATQGFNAVQNALQNNSQNDRQQAGFANDQQVRDQQSSQAMWGAIGQLGGTAIGAAFGGPAGASIGGQVGSTFGNLGSSNKLNSGFGQGGGYTGNSNGAGYSGWAPR